MVGEKCQQRWRQRVPRHQLYGSRLSRCCLLLLGLSCSRQERYTYIWVGSQVREDLDGVAHPLKQRSQRRIGPPDSRLELFNARGNFQTDDMQSEGSGSPALVFQQRDSKGVQNTLFTADLCTTNEKWDL